MPAADADGLILLAPDPGVANYQIEAGYHPFDDDGIGFVYDFEDVDNFARVLFVSQASGATRVPRGVSISRKSGGAWSVLLLGDLGFVYQPGHPFAIRFSNNNGEYHLSAWNLDDPGTVQRWSWNEQRAAASNRFGLTTWGEQDGHFLYATAMSLPERAAKELRITGVRVENGRLTLELAGASVGAHLTTIRVTSPGYAMTVSFHPFSCRSGSLMAFWRYGPMGGLPPMAQSALRMR